MRQRAQGLRNGRADGGFTLIELLIVIVVLGILAGIVVFGVAQFQEDAETAACEADKKTVEVAAQAYSAQHDGDFVNVAGLVADGYLKAAPESGVDVDTTTGAATGTC